MIVSFVLRLLADPALDGRMVGEVEDVATGEHSAIQNGEELLVFLRRRLRPVRLIDGQPHGSSDSA